MKKNDSRVEKFLESLFELNSGDFEQIQGVLTTFDAEAAADETPAEAAKRRTIDEKRKSIANAFFARLQENPPSLGAEGLESLAERPGEDVIAMPLLAVTGSNPLIPGETGSGPAIIPPPGDGTFDLEIDVDMGLGGAGEAAGDLSLLPLEGKSSLMGDLVIAPEPSPGEVSYDDMLSALLITEDKEEESIRLLEVETQRIVEASIIDDDDEESLFDPVPLVALTESDVALEEVKASTAASHMEDVLVAEPAGEHPERNSTPEAAFIKEMFKNRPASPGPPISQEGVEKGGSIDAAEGRSLLNASAGPGSASSFKAPPSQSFDSKAHVNEGVLTYSFAGERGGAHHPSPHQNQGQTSWGTGPQSPASWGTGPHAPVGLQPRPTPPRPSAPGARGNSSDQLNAFRGGRPEQGRSQSQDRMVPENRMGVRPNAGPSAESVSRPAVATSSGARAPIIGTNPSMMGVGNPNDQNGLVPISPNLRPAHMSAPGGGQHIGPHTTGSFPTVQPPGAFGQNAIYTTGSFPVIQPHTTGAFPPIHSGVYQMVDGVPQPLHLPTGAGPASMHSQANAWGEADEWESRSGASRLLSIGLGVTLALVVLLGSVWLGWFYNPSRQTKKAVVAVSAMNPAKVRIESQPTGASVFLGDIATGKVTPVTLRLAPGKHTIVLRKNGFLPQTKKVTIKQEPSLFFQLALAPVPKADVKKVTLYITSSVRKATVWLNGKPTTHTAPVFLKVRPGQYAVQLRKKRYRTRIKVVKVGEKPFYHVKVRWR